MSGYIGTQPVPQATQTRDSFTATSNQTSFATSGYTPNFLDVFLNGVKLAAADYTASNGSDVVLATGATTGDILEVVAYTNFDTANVTGAANFTVTGAFTSQGIDDNANATAITIDANENVGIGTSSPDNSLEIDNSANYQLRLKGAGSSFAELGIDDNNRLRIFSNGAERMRIDSSGNVGIGTSSPSVLLDLESASPIIRLTDSDASGTPECQISGAGGDLIFDADRDNEKASSLMLFKVDGSEAMRIDANGAVKMPAQPAFSATNNTASQTNLAINAYHTVVFGTEIFDQGSDFASNTFTAPVTGRYQFNVQLRLYQVDTAASYYQAYITTSNRGYEVELITPLFTSDPTYLTLSSSFLVDMDAADTAFVRVYQAGGSAQTDLQQGTSIFSGYLVA